MIEQRPDDMTWIPMDGGDMPFDHNADAPIPDHADCRGLPNRYDYSDGMVKFPANGYPGQDAGVFGHAFVSACPFCGKWWHWDYKVFTEPGVVVDDSDEYEAELVDALILVDLDFDPDAESE